MCYHSMNLKNVAEGLAYYVYWIYGGRLLIYVGARL